MFQIINDNIIANFFELENYIKIQTIIYYYYYNTFRQNISVRKIKPNPACAFTLLNLCTIQFEASPRNVPNPPPLTIQYKQTTLARARDNKTRQNTPFFLPDNHHSTKIPTYNQRILLPRGEWKATISTSTLPRRRRCTKTRKRGGKEERGRDESPHNECTRTSRI